MEVVYQEIEKKKHWAPQKIYPKICVLHDAALDVATSVDHEFFTCSKIANVWEHTYTLIDKMMGHAGSCDIAHVLNINLVIITLKELIFRPFEPVDLKNIRQTFRRHLGKIPFN